MKPPGDDAHLPYFRNLLDGALGRSETSDFLYVTRTEGRPGFWELVALRVPGLDRALIGALHFMAQSDDPLAFARRSLGHYLTSPPQPIAAERASYPPEVLDLRVPREGESLPELLGVLKRGAPSASVHLDKAVVEIAADFRAENPSLQRPGIESGPAQRLLFLTGSGHVLRATAINFAVKLRRPGSFVTLTGVEQLLTSSAWTALPNLVVARSFLVAFSEPSEDEGDGRPPSAFGAATVASGHLLDGRLATGPTG
jgi:hypothetical protein